MSNSWQQLFQGRGSVFALDEHTKQWADKGTSGTIIMFQNAYNRQDVRMGWQKNNTELWWTLGSTKLKPKGERALILSAWTTSTNQQEILAIRFINQQTAIQFAKQYNYLFPIPMSGYGLIDNIFQSNNSNPNQNQKQQKPKSNNNYNNKIRLYSNSSDMHRSQSQSQSHVNVSTFEWKCGVCTYGNQQSNLKCQMCGCIPPQVQPDKQDEYEHKDKMDVIHDDKNKWECTACTYSNNAWTNRCDVCNAKKKEPWKCSTCTLLNVATNMRCEACNTISENSVNKYDKLYNANEIKNESTIDDFSNAGSYIACYNNKPSIVFKTLKSVTEKLLKDDPKYTVLDTTNEKVMEKLMGFEGVLEFLMLLGFESDALGIKLKCKNKPSQMVINNALNVLNSYQQKFDQYNVLNSFENINENNPNDILALEQIIVWSTHEKIHENMEDNNTMETLLMTHKMFTDSVTLLKQLKKRFFISIPNDILNTNDENKILYFQNNIQKRIQLKVINALRDWMKYYFFEDFYKNEEILLQLEEWLIELSMYNKLNGCWVNKLYEIIKNEYLRLKSINFDMKLEKQINILSSDDFIHIKLERNDFIKLSKFSSEELADQITLMDYRLFSRIKPRECINQNWKNIKNIKLAPNILLLIESFNNFTKFIQILILRERSLKKRGLAIKRIIKMGQHFKLRRNYNSLCAVFSALNSAPIHRLKLAWNKVPEKQKEYFNEWRNIFCGDFNHRNLRNLLRSVGGNPCIPHIGIFLKDLVFIEEGNRNQLCIPAFNDNKMLNFNKCVRIADRIKNLQLFQYNKYSNTQIISNKKIQKVLLVEFQKLKDISEDQMWDMSTEIKKQDQREAKKNPLGFF